MEFQTVLSDPDESPPGKKAKVYLISAFAIHLLKHIV